MENLYFLRETTIDWGLGELKKLCIEEISSTDIEHENWLPRKVAEKAGMKFLRTQSSNRL